MSDTPRTPPLIANARMYAMRPILREAWRSLLDRAARIAGVECSYVDHPPPLALRDLWRRPDCGCVLMCGLPFIRQAPRPQALAAPVPVWSRYEDKAQYFSEFFVRRNAPFRQLAETFGQRLACMQPESNSGYNAPRHHLLATSEPGVRWRFRPGDQPLHTPAQVIDAVISGAAEVGVVDSYLLDLLRQHDPAVTDQLRTIEVTEASPIPLLMASSTVDRATVEALRTALLAMHRDAQGRTLLTVLGLRRFDPVREADYELTLQREQASDRAGFELAQPGPGQRITTS